MDTTEDIKIVAKNKKARHDFHILETYESGIALTGTEVKSVRNGKITLTDSHAKIRNSELWLLGTHISPYEQGNIFNAEPLRDRKLLMRRREIDKIRKNIEEKGLTLVPLSAYLKNGKVKIELGLARGKKLYDKREDQATREANREMDRARKQRTSS